MPTESWNPDLQELTRYTPGEKPGDILFYVSVEDAKRLLDEIERLRAQLAEARGAAISLAGWLCHPGNHLDQEKIAAAVLKWPWLAQDWRAWRR